MSKTCEDFEVSPAPSSTFEENQGSRKLVQLEWKGVLLDFGTGFLIGMGVGWITVTRKLNWFERTFRIKLRRRPKQ